MPFPQHSVLFMQQSIDLNEALIFATLVEMGSMTATARHLGVQKSTISRKLSALEERIGVRLIQRSTRKQVLTDIGEAHYQRCRDIVQAFENAENHLQRHREEPVGQLKVVAPVEVGHLFLARLIGLFAQRWPGVTVDLELTSRNIDFREEGIDLALQLLPPNDPNLVCRKVRSSSLMLVASPGYVAGKRIEHPSDLRQLNSIRFTPLNEAGTWEFSKGGEHYMHPARGNIGFNSIPAVREAAMVGAGIALLPGVFLEEALESGQLIRLLPGWVTPERHVYAIYPPRRFIPLALSKLLEALSQILNERLLP